MLYRVQTTLQPPNRFPLSAVYITFWKCIFLLFIKKIIQKELSCCWQCVPCEPHQRVLNETACQDCHWGYWPDLHTNGMYIITFQTLKKEKKPIKYFEKIPGQDYSTHCFVTAALLMIVLLTLKLIEVKSWL